MAESDSTTTTKFTPISEIPGIVDRARQAFLSGRLDDLEFRKDQIARLCHMVQDNADRIDEALGLDLGRHKLESSSERTAVISGAMVAYNNLVGWAKPESPPFELKFYPFKPTIYKTPKGVVLTIGPFNAGAIAAGCACVVKMSEHVPHVANLMAELFPKYMDKELFPVINGGVPETTEILNLKWDHIVFTGSVSVAKIVAAAAARHLTPVTLELGGQCPAFVDPDYDLKFAAKRLLWGKVLNAGQVCTAPNHVFIPAEKQDELVEAFKEAYTSFYPEGAENSDSLSHLVSANAFERAKLVLEKTKGTVVCGGQLIPEKRTITPAIVKDVAPGDALLDDELFSPIMPIVPVKDIQEAISFTNSRPHALAAYVFSDKQEFKDLVRNNTQSGGFAVNDCSLHAAVNGLPFGGVGNSGMGMLTGKYSFDTFTHLRGAIESPRFIEMFMGWRYPPYNDAKIKQQVGLNPAIPPIGGYTWGGWLRSWLPF
ncbi:hypothetical protein FRB99_006810 [Tulasnella sp. 403]|nr:hypothetical protein FRB99_006810 [Tulasnella sp. 403]